mgnify:CR=1 FL=1
MPVENSGLNIQNHKNIALTGLTAVITFLFGLPILLGLFGVILPAAGYFPALGKTNISIDAARDFLAPPGLGLYSLLCVKTGLLAPFISRVGSFILMG